MTQSPQFGAPPGWRGARRPEKRVTARSMAPPEEVHGTDLACIARAEARQHTVGLDELAPEPLGGGRVVTGVLGVLVERDRTLDLDRDRPDPNVEPELAQRRHDLGVEDGD